MGEVHIEEDIGRVTDELMEGEAPGDEGEVARMHKILEEDVVFMRGEGKEPTTGEESSSASDDDNKFHTSEERDESFGEPPKMSPSLSYSPPRNT